MQTAALELILKLKDEASKGLAGVQGALRSVGSAAASVGSSVKGFLGGAFQFAVGELIQKGLEGIGGAIGSLKDGLIGGNAEFERYQTQFSVLLGGADAAKQRLNDLAKFGATTPFELPQIVVADKILQSFGLHAQDAAQRFGFAGADIRTIAGDVAAGTGAQFEEIANYIGKFASGATGETIARFQELGIVTKSQLAEMGLAFDKGGSLIIGSQQDLDKATQVLLTAMKDKYGGMMNAQSATFEGMVSNLQDWKAQTLRTIGAPIFEVLKDKLGAVLAWLPTIQPQIDAFAQTLAGGIGTAITWLSDTAIPRLVSGWERLSGLFGQVQNAVAPVLPILQSLGQYVLAVVEDGDYLNDFLTHLPAPIQPIVQALGELVNAAMLVVDGFGDGGLGGALRALPEAALGALNGIGELRIRAVELLGAVLPGIIDQVSKWGFALLDWIADAGPPMLRQLGAQTGRLLDAIGAALPGIVEALAKWGAALTQWVIDNGPNLLRQLGAMLADVLAWIVARAPGILEKLGEWALAFLKWAAPTAAKLIIAAGELLGELLTWIVRHAPDILETLGAWAKAFGEWAITKGLPALGQALLDLAGGLWSYIKDKWNSAFQPGTVGAALVASIKSGILSAWDGFKGRLLDLIINAIPGARAVLSLAGGGGGSAPQIPGFAAGVTNFGGGLAYVHAGELLVNLPRGTDVIPAPQSAGLLRGGAGGGGGVAIGAIHIHVDEAVPDARRLARDLVEPLRDEFVRLGVRNLTWGVT